MKSERRHELQTNYLADHLGTAVETGKPFAVWILGGAIGVAIAAMGYGLYSTWAQQSSAAAWGEYYFNLSSTDAEAFQKVVDDYPDSQAAAWAKQNLADSQLVAGLDLVYSDKDQAAEKLKSAISNYETISKSTYDMELKDRATIGLAQAYEGLGKLDDAAKYYQQVAGSNVLPALAATASQRLAFIKSPEGKEFYSWFATAKRTPDAPPAVPNNLSVPPATPDMSFPVKPSLPEAGITTSPSSTTGAIELPSSPTPPADPAPPADQTAPAAPLESTPSATPAADPTPETDAPKASEPTAPTTPATDAPK